MLRRTRWLAGVVTLAIVAFLASALIPGSHGSGQPRFALAEAAPLTSARDPARDPLPIHVAKAFGASGTAKRYGTLDARRENQGIDAQGHLTSDLTPLSPRDFRRPILAYRRYAESWAARLAGAVSTLRVRLSSGGRRQAEQAWSSAYFDFMHLGADYNLLPAALTDQLAEVPPEDSLRHFPGLHRIERGLWTGQPLSSLRPAAAGVAAAVAQLRRILPTVPIATLAYTLRIHEVLEDAQRDLLSGTDVPWSGDGVLATEAGVVATRELLTTVRPILEGRDNSYVESRNWLDQLQQTLLAVRHRNGTWPTIHQLTLLQRERINAAMAGTLSALEQVPGALETRAVDAFPSIPKRNGGTR